MTELQQRLRDAALWSPIRERDLVYLRTGSDEVLVVACDSDGGLGPKPADTVAVAGYDLGRFATRVPLLEVIAAGGTPVLVVDTLAVELEPTGATIIDGVRAEAESAGLAADAVTGSTEDNVPTVATGVGVTVLARARIDALRAGSAGPGDLLAVVGKPMSAPAHRFGPDTPGVLSCPALTAALSVPGVVEALPIGSSGVSAELDQLARTVGLSATRTPDWPFDPDQSGGPSTAALVAIAHVADSATALTRLADATGLPVTPVAHLARDGYRGPSV